MEKKHSAQRIWESTEEEENLLSGEVSDRMWTGIDRRYRKYKRQRALKISSVLILIPIMGLLLMKWNQHPTATESTLVYQTGLERDTVQLADGTQVYLEANSKLTVSADFGQEMRKVTFDGLAYFDVAKDKGKPFVIDAIDFSVQVLGTQFHLSSRPSEQKVTLIEGKVKVEKGEQPQYLLAGEVWEYSSNEGEQRYHMASSKQNFSFQEEEFGAVIAHLEKHYHTTIKYPQIFKSRKVSGAFNGDLKAILKIIGFPFDLTVHRINEHEIIMQKKHR